MSKDRAMEVRYFFTWLLLVFMFVAGCEAGYFRKDLYEIFNLSVDDQFHKSQPKKYLGIEAVVGPLPRTRGLRFNESANVKYLQDRKFANAANFILTSTDLSVAAHFKIMGIKKNERHAYFPIFAMSDKQLVNRYFSIGLEAKQSVIIVEGKEYFKNHTWAVYVEQWVPNSKSSAKTSFELGNNMKFGKWVSLVVRIRNESVSVLLDCKEVVKGELLEGRIGRFSYEGKMTFAQMGKTKEDRNQFVGSLYGPQLINTPKAYDFWSPCVKHQPSVVVPEPRADTYDPKRFQEFQEMENQVVKKPLLTCKTKTKTGEVIKLTNNGDYYVYKDCFKYKCVDGEVILKYRCRKCRDGNSEFKVLDVWTAKADSCTERTCVFPSRVKSKRIVCKTLTCPLDEQYQPTGKCCRKCRGDDCSQGKIWYSGCARKCSLGVEQTCTKGEERKACWCPAGTAMNHQKTKCIETGECKCKIGTKMYLPGQSIKRSQCSNCICSHGLLTCFETC